MKRSFVPGLYEDSPLDVVLEHLGIEIIDDALDLVETSYSAASGIEIQIRGREVGFTASGVGRVRFTVKVGDEKHRYVGDLLLHFVDGEGELSVGDASIRPSQWEYQPRPFRPLTSERIMQELDQAIAQIWRKRGEGG